MRRKLERKFLTRKGAGYKIKLNYERSKLLLFLIFRNMHTLKGNSATLGLEVMNLIAHRSENVLDKVRKKLWNVQQSYPRREKEERAKRSNQGSPEYPGRAKREEKDKQKLGDAYKKGIRD